MLLTYDAATIRLFLEWDTSVQLDHDVDHRGLNTAVDQIQALPYVAGVDIGSGHAGMYLDIHLSSDIRDIHQRITDLIDYAKGLKL